MRAGRQRHRFSLQSPTNTLNEFGESVQSWTTYATVWGNVLPLSGKERERAGQMAAEATHDINMRYQSALRPNHRILWGTRTFEIQSVVTICERDRYTKVLAKEAL